MAVDEIAVVLADRDRHPRGDRGVQRLDRQAPLFGGVSGEHLVEDIVAQPPQIRIVPRLSQVMDAAARPETEALDQSLRHPLGRCGWKQRLDRIQIERQRHPPAVHLPLDPMGIGPPGRELAQIVEDTRTVCVEDVRAIGMDQPPARIAPVVRIAADMVALIDHQHALVQPARQSFGDHRPGETGADDQPVISPGHRASRRSGTARPSAPSGRLDTPRPPPPRR